jgi:V/A-type H+-transporting ATPase subunit D
MAKQINPTRMELTRLKRRLKTAARGHKLLKDKQNGMTKQFMEQIRRNRELRNKVESELAEAARQFSAASSAMGEKELGEALLLPSGEIGVSGGSKNIMSVSVPTLSCDGSLSASLPYGFADTSYELDTATLTMTKLFPTLLQLAECEKTCDMLASEIEKTRRRVNALEHVMIPEMERNIKFITMKLEDNERQNITRLMKVKDVINSR